MPQEDNDLSYQQEPELPADEFIAVPTLAERRPVEQALRMRKGWKIVLGVRT